MSIMKIKAFRLKQKNQIVYTTVLSASELMAHAEADKWDSKTNKGYQREISTIRTNKAGKYILNKEGILPQSVVLNIRETEKNKVRFTKIEDMGIYEYGTLEIPDEIFILWEVDGQHRIGGLEYAISKNPEYSNYPVNVSIMTIDEYSEMKQFYIINTEMKGVRADLAERLISEMVLREGEKEYRKHGKTRELFIAKATKIVDILNKQIQDQPWFQAIHLPNDEKSPLHIIEQRSMVTSLKPVLRVTEGIEADIVAKILGNYWQALKELFTPAFEQPHDYLIQKTLGLFVFHMLFPRVFALCGGDYRKEKMKEILKKLEISYQSWHKNGEYKPYGGMKGFNYLALSLEEYLEDEKYPIKL